MVLHNWMVHNQNHESFQVHNPIPKSHQGLVLGLMALLLFQLNKKWINESLIMSFQSNLTFLVHKEAVALPIFRRLVAQLLTEFPIHYFSYFRWAQLALENFQMIFSYLMPLWVGLAFSVNTDILQELWSEFCANSEIQNFQKCIL